MKNFMKKLPVMITLLALTAVWLGVYLFMQLRPVAYGMSYKHTKTEEGVTTTTYYKLNCDDTAELRFKSLGTEQINTVWYIKEGKYIVFGMMSNETQAGYGYFKSFDDFKKYVADQKLLNKDTVESNYDNRVYRLMYTMTGTAFFGQICHYEGSEQVIHNCTNYETITFSVIGGIFILILIAGSVWSTLLFIKDRKNKTTPVQVEPAAE